MCPHFNKRQVKMMRYLPASIELNSGLSGQHNGIDLQPNILRKTQIHAIQSKKNTQHAFKVSSKDLQLKIFPLVLNTHAANLALWTKQIIQ